MRSSDPDDVVIVPHPHANRRNLTLITVPLLVMVAMSYAADFLWPTLVDTHPLWLISLSSRNRYLLMTTESLDAFSYYTVGTLRLLLSDPLFYLLGLLYGDRAIGWMERKFPSLGGYLRQLEGVFGWLGYPLVLFMPNNPICLLAGASGMRPLVFFVLNLVGTIGRLYMIRVLGDAFSSPLSSFMDFVGEYRWQVLVVTTTLGALSLWWDHRQGSGEIEALRSLGSDLDEAKDAPAERADDTAISESPSDASD